MYSASSSDRLDELERKLAEMQRRTMSSLSITNPSNNVSMVNINQSYTALNDKNGATILYSATSSHWGYSNPWQNYVVVPSAPPSGSVFAGGFVDSQVAYFWPNQPRMLLTIKTVMTNIDPSVEPTGAIGDWQVVYSVDGVGSTAIPGLSGSTSTPEVTVTQSASYLWPADYFNHKIQLRYQCRIRPGTGNGDDYMLVAPTRLYGGPK
jgi:hypothetical protein